MSQIYMLDCSVKELEEIIYLLTGEFDVSLFDSSIVWILLD